jgi:hypothetical protein
LYFLPNLRKQQCDSVSQMRAILKERGLTDVFADVPQEAMCIVPLDGRGPEDKSGVILAYTSPATDIPRRIDFRPAEQEWTKVDDGLYIGIDTAEPPTPDDLQRAAQFGGYWAPLNGHKWLIPVIRRPDDTTLLPRSWKWDATGRDVQPIKREYRAFWDETAEVLGWFLADELPATATSVRALELCVRALSINYRFGRNEQNLIGPIDPDNAMTILGITVDYPRFSEIQKKTSALPPLNSGAGPTADSLTTDQAAAS